MVGPIRTAKGQALGSRNKPTIPEDVKLQLKVFSDQLKDATNESHEGKKKKEALWPIFQITHQRSRWIWEERKSEKISEPLYRHLIKKRYADKDLISKWEKQGYEKLCCTQCIQAKETNFNSTCICRVPKAKLQEDQTIECVNCGCRGCASGD